MHYFSLLTISTCKYCVSLCMSICYQFFSEHNYLHLSGASAMGNFSRGYLSTQHERLSLFLLIWSQRIPYYSNYEQPKLFFLQFRLDWVTNGLVLPICWNILFMSISLELSRPSWFSFVGLSSYLQLPCIYKCINIFDLDTEIKFLTPHLFHTQNSLKIFLNYTSGQQTIFGCLSYVIIC